MRAWWERCALPTGHRAVGGRRRGELPTESSVRGRGKPMLRLDLLTSGETRERRSKDGGAECELAVVVLQRSDGSEECCSCEDEVQVRVVHWEGW